MAKIIFITSRFPYPLNKGDKLRTYFQIRHLAKTNEIHLLSINESELSDVDMEALKPYCKSIHTFVLPLRKRIIPVLISPLKKLPLQVAFFYNRKIKTKINDLVSSIDPDHIHCHLIRTTEYVRDMKDISISLDFMDAFGQGMEKREHTENNFLKRMVYRYEKNLLYAYENKAFSFAQKYFIISDQDKKSIRSERSSEIKILPNGVDFETFFPRQVEKHYDLVFMGNLGYPPNIAAVMFLAEKIIPLVTRQHPSIKLLIAGIEAPEKIRRLRSANIDVIENFKDISDSMAISKIMLAPMLISIGLQNKILQGMAMKMPCIVSTLSNNAIKAPVNKALLEANSAEEFAQAITYLINNPSKAEAIASAGFEFVKENYSWEKQNAVFLELIAETK